MLVPSFMEVHQPIYKFESRGAGRERLNDH